MAALLQRQTGKRKGYAPMAEMNVVPFIDVMLVLLIIFMVAAPMLTQGVQVQLPKANAKPIEQDKPVEVTLAANGIIKIGSSEVTLDQLLPRLQAIQSNRDNVAVLIRADKSLDYGSVMKVMAALQASGMVDVGLATEQEQ